MQVQEDTLSKIKEWHHQQLTPSGAHSIVLGRSQPLLEVNHAYESFKFQIGITSDLTEPEYVK